MPCVDVITSNILQLGWSKLVHVASGDSIRIPNENLSQAFSFCIQKRLDKTKRAVCNRRLPFINFCKNHLHQTESRLEERPLSQHFLSRCKRTNHTMGVNNSASVQGFIHWVPRRSNCTRLDTQQHTWTT